LPLAVDRQPLGTLPLCGPQKSKDMAPESTRSQSPGDPGPEVCAFCAIARGYDQSVAVVCEDNSWIAFFPLQPATPGHTLVIPRAHFPDLWSVDPDTGVHLMAAVIRVGQAITHALRPEGMNLISSSGRAAEQTVFHVHLHLVPRWSSDGFGRIWPPDRPSDRSLEADVAERIRAACAGT
jgi:histidine triad (HIT) family protein